MAAITSEQALAPAITDRLIPPVSMVMPMPSANMPKIGNCEEMDWKLPMLKNCPPSVNENNRATARMISNCKRMMRSAGINRVKVVMSHSLCQFAFLIPCGAADADQNDHAAENLMPVRRDTQQRRSEEHTSE